MPSVLIQHGKGKNAVYTKLHSFKSGYNGNNYRLKYNGDDEVSEQHRKQDNRTAFSYVAGQLKKMRIEVRNGFKELSKPEQTAVISNKKNGIESILREIGSFLPDEIPPVLCRTSRLVERIYVPYIKWTRKKNNSVY